MQELDGAVREEVSVTLLEDEGSKHDRQDL